MAGAEPARRIARERAVTTGVAGALPLHLLHRSRDAWLVGFSLLHAAALLALPSIPLVAIGLWWNANTVAHNFIHRPFFRRRTVNRAYSVFLSAVLGFPQSIWRERHLAHHADRPVRLRLGAAPAIETVAMLAVWAACASVAPRTFFLVYLPGWALGLTLCHIQGHYEHARGVTSHYGWLYNLLFFNDGHHAEHHQYPGRHWSQLGCTQVPSRASRWPPVLRWLDTVTLEGLERIVLRSRLLQRLVLDAHERAFRRLVPASAAVRSVLVVGGGLFPRSAIVLRRILPNADVTILDANADHLRIANSHLSPAIALRQGLFTGTLPVAADIAVIPLSYTGDRRRIYEHPPAPVTLVHDWIWARHGRGAVISIFLLKRVNLVEPLTADAGAAAVEQVRRSA